MIIGTLLLLYISLVLHETGHILAVISTHTAIDRFRITLLGFNVQLDTIKLSFSEKLYVYFAGPLTNLVMFCFFYKYELYEAATINAFLCFMNLLPIVPLDGGNIIRTIIEKITDTKKASLCSIAINSLVILFAFYCLFLSKNIVYVAITAMALKGILQEKQRLKEYKILDIYRKMFY